MRTEIRNGTVIAWIGGRHQVLDPGIVVFEGNEIVFVGADYDGEADEVIDASGRLVMPGLVNAHLHVTDTPFTKGRLEDIGDAQSANWSNIALRSTQSHGTYRFRQGLSAREFCRR